MVAIKALSPNRAAGPESRRRFVYEAQASSGLKYPNIATVHDIGNADGSESTVMEFVAGRTLDRLISSGPLRETETLRYGVQVADALARAHAIGLIHRDLKPSNIIVTDEGSVKLLDFRPAELSADEDRARTETQSLPHTAEGTILGTVASMSPEKAQGRRLDVRPDVFSLGAVLYEMLSVERPFKAESQMVTLLAIAK